MTMLNVNGVESNVLGANWLEIQALLLCKYDGC